jgi:putative transposase
MLCIDNGCGAAKVQEIKRKHLGEQAWCEVLQRFDGAGVTVAEFCRREGLSKSSFQRWRSLLRAATRSQPIGEREDRPQELAASQFVDLGALGGADSGTGRLQIKLDLGGGIVLQLTRG